MTKRLAVILKKPASGVRVADGAVLADLSRRSGAATGTSTAFAPIAPTEPSAEMLETLVQDRLATHLADARRQQAQQLQQAEATWRQQADAAHTAVEAERAALASSAAALERAVGELADLRKRVLAEAERQVLDLAVDMARTVLRQEVDGQRYDPAPIVQAALDQLPAHAEVTVTLNPADFARYNATAQAGDTRMRVRSDGSVPPAGCRVECGQGVVEADPARQLDHIHHTLLSDLAEAG